MEAGVFVSSNEVLLMYQEMKLRTERKSSDLNKMSNLMMLALEKGLDEFQMNELIKSLKILPDKKYTFNIAGTKGRDSNYYYYLIGKEKKGIRNKIKFAIKKFFSRPKKREELEDQRIAREIAGSYIQEMLETALDKGLSRDQECLFRELAYFLYYTSFELEIQEKKESDKTTIILYSY